MRHDEERESCIASGKRGTVNEIEVNYFDSFCRLHLDRPTGRRISVAAIGLSARRSDRRSDALEPNKWFKLVFTFGGNTQAGDYK